MIVTMPIFYPIVVDYLGFSPMWFGVLLVILIGIGGITPPVGAGIFLLKGCIHDPEVTITGLFKSVVPFIVVNVAGAILIIIFPQIVDFLPNLIYGATS
jgi:TRAP-type C4-dicarboxylate transport system permease large subunit